MHHRADLPRFQTRTSTTKVSFCGTFLIHATLPHFFVALVMAPHCCDSLSADATSVSRFVFPLRFMAPAFRSNSRFISSQQANTNGKHDPH
jgi:hypothetical protein